MANQEVKVQPENETPKNDFSNDAESIQNYAFLSRARLADDEVSVVPSTLMNPAAYDESQTADHAMQHQERIQSDEDQILRIIQKGKYSNIIAKAMRNDKMEKSDQKRTENDLEDNSSTPKNSQKYSSFMIPETSTAAVSTPLEAIEEETQFKENSNVIAADKKSESTDKTEESKVTEFTQGTQKKDAEPVAVVQTENQKPVAEPEKKEEQKETPASAPTASRGGRRVRMTAAMKAAQVAKAAEQNETPSEQKPGPQEQVSKPAEQTQTVQPVIPQPALPQAHNQRTPTGRTRRRVVKSAERKEKKVIVCTVEIDGELHARKPLYFPEVDPKKVFEMSVVDAKDLIDISSIIKQGIDFITVSCVESRNDIEEVKELLSVKGRHIKLLAKVQNKKAVQNFKEILEASDGIVIARGYLGMEFQLEDIAFIQKFIINSCNRAGKPVILSTQIMESMITRLRPTRAEVSDISNAVYDGIDCCILTGETGTGRFYKESTDFMANICYEAEQNIDFERNYNQLQSISLHMNNKLSVEECMSNNAVNAAFMLNAKLIICFTEDGEQAKLASKYHPSCPILAVFSDDKSSKNVLLHSGIQHIVVGSLIGGNRPIEQVKKQAVTMGLVQKGDYIIIMTGMHEGFSAGNNLIKPERI